MDCEHVKRKITKRKEGKKWEKASSLDFYQLELLRFVTVGSGQEKLDILLQKVGQMDL